MRNCPRKRLNARLASLKRGTEEKVPRVTLLYAMTFWNLKESVCLELEYFCSQNNKLLAAGQRKVSGDSFQYCTAMCSLPVLVSSHTINLMSFDPLIFFFLCQCHSEVRQNPRTEMFLVAHPESRLWYRGAAQLSLLQHPAHLHVFLIPSKGGNQDLVNQWRIVANSFSNKTQ